MDVKIQFTDGTITIVDHSQFMNTIRNKEIFRFAIGNCEIYNHDFYALEVMPDHILVSEWDLATSYPEQNWTEPGHACVYQIYSPTKWIRTQYGQGCPNPWSAFTIPKNNIKISGILVSDPVANQLYTDWPVTKLSDYSREGM